jgi:hypothetical protein
MLYKILDYLFRKLKKVEPASELTKYPHPVIVVIPNHAGAIALDEKCKSGIRFILVEYDEPLNGPSLSDGSFRARAWFPEGYVIENEAQLKAHNRATLAVF